MFGGDDDEERRRAKQEFEDVDNRQAFIRNVFSILAVQLWFTFGAMFFVITNEDAKSWVISNIYLVIVASIVALISMCALTCCFQGPPCNYVLLVIITIAEAYLISAIACMYRPEIILMAVGTAAIVIFVLSLFAIHTTIDFTICTGLILVMVILLLILSLVCAFFPSRLLLYIIAASGVFIFSILLICDIQLIIGGKNRSMAYRPDDYVAAAVMIYFDIILIFLYILQLIGLMDD